MKLSERKIKYLSEKIVDEILQNNKIKFNTDKSTISAKIDKILTNEAKIEEEIEAETYRLLETYKEKIKQEKLDRNLLYIKIKHQLAKDKGVIL